MRCWHHTQNEHIFFYKNQWSWVSKTLSTLSLRIPISPRNLTSVLWKGRVKKKTKKKRVYNTTVNLKGRVKHPDVLTSRQVLLLRRKKSRKNDSFELSEVLIVRGKTYQRQNRLSVHSCFLSPSLPPSARGLYLLLCRVFRVILVCPSWPGDGDQVAQRQPLRCAISVYHRKNHYCSSYFAIII